MSQYHIRELTLLNINEYTFYIGNREESFQEHITPLNYLFIQMDQIHQELIVYHVQFDDNETEYLDSIAGNMSYITNEASLGNMNNRYRTIVSSVNLALYHILNLTIDDMYTANKDVFFFLSNSFNSIYIGHSKSIDLSQHMVVDSLKSKE